SDLFEGELGFTSIRPQYCTVIANNVGIPGFQETMHVTGSPIPASPTDHHWHAQCECQPRAHGHPDFSVPHHAQTVDTVVSLPGTAGLNKKFLTTLTLIYMNRDSPEAPV